MIGSGNRRDRIAAVHPIPDNFAMDAAPFAGAVLVARAWRLRSSGKAHRRAAHRLLAFSMSYLFALFAAPPASNTGTGSSSMGSARADPLATR
jgi:heme O synthase-like polyprenyltransferase